MKEKIKVLIADDSHELCETLKNYFNKTEDILVTAIAYDGQQALRKIDLVRPDVVLLDVIMPKLDGIGVLKALEKSTMSKKPLIIMMSALSNDAVLKSCTELGAYYYMVKPFDDLSHLAERIRDFKHRPANESKETQPVLGQVNEQADSSINDKNIQVAVTELMHDIGMPAHVKGYEFMRTAVLMCLKDRSIINSITKELYPEIAKQYQTNAPRVERAIRHAIELAWSRGKPEIINNIFGYTINNSKGKPTNGECIAMLADHLRTYNNVG